MVAQHISFIARPFETMQFGAGSLILYVLCDIYTSSDAEDWFCECPPLYTGRLCQLTSCERNPCSRGATCIPKSPLEAICLCPYGRQGLLCDQSKYFTEQLHTEQCSADVAASLREWSADSWWIRALSSRWNRGLLLNKRINEIKFWWKSKKYSSSNGVR